VTAIAAEIPPPPAAEGSAPAADAAAAGGEPASPGLASGHAGRALFYAYLAAASGAEAGRALAHLDAACEALAREPLGPDLYAGFTGVAWTLRHLAGVLPGAPLAADATEEIDGALLDLLDGPWTGPYDLVTGLAGIGVYALERPPGTPVEGAAASCLERVVDRLAAAAVTKEAGAAWFTLPELLPEHQRREAPAGYFNLGVAHGVPGVLPVLAGCAAAGVARESARRLLEAAAAWLLAQEQPAAADSAFASWLGPGIAPQPSRLAWCYGDAGVAAALFAAARAAGRSDWEAAALRVARRAAALPAERAGVRDAALCHGAAGLGHLFHRLHQATGDEALAEAAGRWLLAVLGMRRPGRGIGGFRSWEPSRGGWRDEAGFLTGAAGIGLALLAALSPVAPDWDRVLACAVAPATGAAPGGGA
jgi:lantibiotic modifying enzyme